MNEYSKLHYSWKEGIEAYTMRLQEQYKQQRARLKALYPKVPTVPGPDEIPVKNYYKHKRYDSE